MPGFGNGTVRQVCGKRDDHGVLWVDVVQAFHAFNSINTTGTLKKSGGGAPEDYLNFLVHGKVVARTGPWRGWTRVSEEGDAAYVHVQLNCDPDCLAAKAALGCSCDHKERRTRAGQRKFTLVTAETCGGEGSGK